MTSTKKKQSPARSSRATKTSLSSKSKATSSTKVIRRKPSAIASTESKIKKAVERKNAIRDNAESPADLAKVNAVKLAQDGDSKISVEIISLDPSFAQALIENTPARQRNIRKMLVDRYAADMLTGRWRVTGEPILLTPDLQLINGQHRCHAVVKAGVTLPDIVLGIVHDERAFEAIDQGAVRSLRDVVKMAGARPANPAVMAAVIYEYLDFKPRKLSMPEKLQIVTAFPDLDTVKKLQSTQVASAGILAAFIRCSRLDHDSAVKFFEGAIFNRPMIDGKFEENCNLLATWVLQTKNDRRIGKSAEGWKRECAARCFYAWNAWREGRILKRIMYKPEFEMPVPV